MLKWSLRNIILSIALIGYCFAGNNASLARDGDEIGTLNRLAEHGNAKALYHLGMMYLTGTRVNIDRQRALRYFQRAAKLDDPLANYKLGCFYDGQYGLLKTDYDLALQHKLIAAQAGYALAQQDVAHLYYLKKNYAEAMHWLKKAVEQGTPSALSTYASIHNGAPGIAKDPVITAAYFTLFLNRAGGSDSERQWLQDFEKGMSYESLARVAEIVRNYHPSPSALTLEALSGEVAARHLLKTGS